MLTIKDLNQYYGESHTLWDLNLSVEKGLCTCLMGRNGVGKTTLLKTIMGLLPAESGGMMFEEKELIKTSADLRAHIGIGYVPQGRDIFPRLTVEENLRIGLLARKGDGEEVLEMVFGLFPVLKQMLARMGGDLSGGQQQQLAISRALLINPKLLILDEPTEGIQPNIVHEIGNIILKLNQEMNITVLLVEQKLPFARHVAQRFCILDKGRSVAMGKMQDLGDELVNEYLTV